MNITKAFKTPNHIYFDLKKTLSKLKETKPKSEFETQSTLINDEERAAARKRFRDPAKKANTETGKCNFTL
jgi:hypothetical protein